VGGHLAAGSRPKRARDDVNDSVYVMKWKDEQDVILLAPLPCLHQRFYLRLKIRVGRYNPFRPARSAARVEYEGPPILGNGGPGGADS
jgi:hypothetical protein